MIANCTALILAGGDSRRMGRDKASLPLGEQTLLQRVLAVVQPLFPDVLLSLRAPRPEIDLPQVCDTQVAAGPLAGLAAGLAQARTGWIFAVATDMPFVQPAVITHLATRRDNASAETQAIVPVVDGHPQPLAAFYAKSCLPVVDELLAGDGKHSLRALLARLDVLYVDAAELRAADPQLRSFFDLDTPADLAAATR